MAKQSDLPEHAKGTPKRLFVLNGKEFKEEELTEDAVEAAPYTFVGFASSEAEEITYGFATVAELDEFVGKRSKEEREAYRSFRVDDKRSRKLADIPKGELEEIKRRQIAQQRHLSEKLDAYLEGHGVDTSDGEKVIAALQEADPLYGMLTLVLYDGPYFTGERVALGPGNYPDLGWFGFNNLASSFYMSGCYGKFRKWDLRDFNYAGMYGVEIFHNPACTGKAKPVMGRFYNKISSLKYRI